MQVFIAGVGVVEVIRRPLDRPKAVKRVSEHHGEQSIVWSETRSTGLLRRYDEPLPFQLGNGIRPVELETDVSKGGSRGNLGGSEDSRTVLHAPS